MSKQDQKKKKMKELDNLFNFDGDDDGDNADGFFIVQKNSAPEAEKYIRIYSKTTESGSNFW